MKPAQNNLLVELHVPDFGDVKKFYGKLGFNVVRENRPEGKKGYLVLQMQDNILCFWAGNEHVYEQSYFQQFPEDTKRGYAVEIIIMVADIDAYYERVKDGVHVVDKLVSRPWGLKDFRIEDPFGFYLRVTSTHNVIDTPHADQ